MTPSCAVLITPVSGDSATSMEDGDLIGRFEHYPLLELVQLREEAAFFPQSLPHSPSTLIRCRRRRNRNARLFIFLTPSTPICLYILSPVLEAITTTLWPIKFSRAVFQGMLVYMRFWKRVCTWKRIISLFKKKEGNTACTWESKSWGVGEGLCR